MRDPFDFAEKSREAPQGPKKDMARDGYTVRARGERGSYSPWSRRGMDLKNDDGPNLTQYPEDGD